MEDLKTRLIEALLETMTYDDMSEKQEELVTEYETEKWKPKVEDLIESGMVKEKIIEQIHDWWMDYLFTDGTEDNLLEHVENIFKE